MNIIQQNIFGIKQTITSPLNYIGGKRKLLPQILPLFPNNISTFVDLFCGGCTVGMNVDAEKIIFNDNLTYLIDMYEAFLRTDEAEVVSYIEKRIDEFGLSLTNKDGYLKLRSTYNTVRNPLDLFVLIAYSFNHQIRFNAAHEYNNPFGRERSCYNPKMKENLISFLHALHAMNVDFSNKDFRDFDYSSLTPNDFVYADPPYLITTGTYNDGKRGFTGWGETEERDLLEILASLHKKGIRIALSNMLRHKQKFNDILHSWIKENGFIVHELNMSYTNSNYQSVKHGQDKTLEVLVTNYREG